MQILVEHIQNNHHKKEVWLLDKLWHFVFYSINLAWQPNKLTDYIYSNLNAEYAYIVRVETLH